MRCVQRPQAIARHSCCAIKPIHTARPDSTRPSSRPARLLVIDQSYTTVAMASGARHATARNKCRFQAAKVAFILLISSHVTSSRLTLFHLSAILATANWVDRFTAHATVCHGCDRSLRTRFRCNEVGRLRRGQMRGTEMRCAI